MGFCRVVCPRAVGLRNLLGGSRMWGSVDSLNPTRLEKKVRRTKKRLELRVWMCVAACRETSYLEVHG